MRGIVRFFVERPLFANLLSLFIFMSGVMSLLLMKREFFPNVNFEVIFVSTVYPGASAEDVERKITEPIEEDLQEIENVRRIASVSSEGMSLISIELDPDQADEIKAERDVQNIVDRFDDLPEDAKRPVVSNLEFGDSPLIEIAVKSETLSSLELRRVARRIEKDVERIKGVARVDPRGMQDEEIRVEVSPEKLKAFRISINEVVRALSARNISLPGGILETTEGSEKEKIIRTTGDFESLEDIESMVVRSNDLGRSILIRDLGKVSWGLEKPKILNRTNAAPSISLTVIKAEAADAIDLRDRLQIFIDDNLERYEGAQLEMVNDSSIIIENRLDVLSNNLLQGIALVIVILTLFLSLRISLLVSVSIPLSFLATIGVFYICGVSFNVVSLIGLIIVSGLLTDNAVVVVDNVSLLMKRGMSPIDAAVEGTLQVWRSITASTLGIVIAFLPMLFMTGIFGKIITAIPLGVILALAISLLVSFFILPAQFAYFVRDPKLAEGKNGRLDRFLNSIANAWDDRVVPRYRRILVWIIERRYRMAAGILIFTFGGIFLLLKVSKTVLFPSDGIEIFYIDTTTEVGIPLSKHRDLLKPIEAIVQSLPKEELLNFNTVIGEQSEGPGDPEMKRGDQYARIFVFLTRESERERTADKIIEDLRTKIGEQNRGFKHLNFNRVNAGPPVGKPISVGVRGDDFNRINEVVNLVKEHLKTVPGALDIQDSFNPGKNELQVRVNGAEASAAKLSDEEVARAVLAAFEGVEATSIRKRGEEIHIRVQYPLSDRQKPESLGQILVENRMGQLIPLREIASWKEVPALASISHEGFDRQVKVTGDIDTNLNDADSVADSVRQQIPEWQKTYPDIQFFFGGEDQDTKESFAALGRAFIVAIIGIFLVLVLTFNTFLQPFLILITIPFGALSALIAFGAHGMPLSFFGMLGIIALGGVIVNNAIVLIDFVNQEREAGLNRFESIYEAGSRRLRAIFLSTITNIIAVIPTAYGFGGEDKFVVPIAIALGWGLAMGSVLTAVFFPSFLAILDDVEDFLQRRFGVKL